MAQDFTVGVFRTVENVLARLSVLAPLAMGFERATLVFSESRVILAYVAKRSSRFLLSAPGRRLVGALKSGEEDRRRRQIETSSPDQLVAADPSNIQISYNDLVSAQLVIHKTAGSELTVLTKEEKFLFKLVAARPPEGFAEVLEKMLGDRFSTKLTD